MSSSALTTTLSIPALRSTVRGRVIAPDDADYDEGAHGLPRRRRPASCRDRPDRSMPMTSLRSSRSPARPVSIWPSEAAATVLRAMASTDGGIVLDLGDMRSIDIDVDGQTVWAQTGLTAAELSTALGAHGLAVGFGDTGSVGIGGITLGGGIGYLVRKFGLTIDSLLAADIVTADGETLRVRRLVAPGPLLGDPRRRRQLRRRDRVPVPAPSASPNSPAGC